MKSSIDFLIDQLSPYICFPLGESAGHNLKDVFDKAKEIHKDEVIKAHKDGYCCCDHFPNLELIWAFADEYYKDTFTK